MAPSIADDVAYIPAVNFTEATDDPAAPGSGHALLYIKAGGVYVRHHLGSPAAVGASPALTENLLGVGDSGGLLSALPAGATGAVPTRQADGSLVEEVPSGASGGNNASPIYIHPAFYSAISAGSLSWTSATAQPYGGYYSTSAPGTTWTVDYPLYLEAGTWTVGYLAVKSNSSAIYTVTLSGGAVGTWDSYAASNQYNQKVEHTGVAVATTGSHTLRFATPTKNGSSAAYNLFLSSIVLTRTA